MNVFWCVLVCITTLNGLQSEYVPNHGKLPIRPRKSVVTIQPNFSESRELADIQLIKHLSRNRQPPRPRRKRRPKPVYGPPSVKHGQPINEIPPPRPKPPSSSFVSHHRPQNQNSYLPLQEFGFSGHQHDSFGEPPDTHNTSEDDENDESLPIQTDSVSYMLPPSTSYGVPVAPIINVYPDKLEYLKNNQPPSLYHLFDSIPPTVYQSPYNQETRIHNFAEPKFNSSLETYKVPTGYHIVKDINSEVGEIGEQGAHLLSDDEYDLDELNEQHASTEHTIQQSSNHIHIPNQQYVNDLLGSSDTTGSSSTFSHSKIPPKNQHNLDTDDLREQYSSGSDRRVSKPRERFKPVKNHQHQHQAPDRKTQAKFGSRIPKSKIQIDEHSPENYVLISAGNQHPEANSNVTSSNQTQSPRESKNNHKRNLAGRVSNYHKLHVPASTSPTLNVTNESLNTTQLNPSPSPKFEIMSIEQSQSQSFYAGTVAPQSENTTHNMSYEILPFVLSTI